MPLSLNCFRLLRAKKIISHDEKVYSNNIAANEQKRGSPGADSHRFDAIQASKGSSPCFFIAKARHTNAKNR